MNCLIVFAHPEPASFNGALMRTAVNELERLGHSVVVSDLYRLDWNPSLGADDFPRDRVDTEFLDLSKEQQHAFISKTHSSDVATEQAKVEAADFVLFQFPMWWFSMPAILKGWVDRVFSRGFAYSAGHKYESGHFKGKRAMLSLTTGTASTLYEPNGIDGDLHHVLWPIHNGILAYTGFTVLPPFSAWMPAQITPEARQVFLDDFAMRLRSMDGIEPMFFHPRSDYDQTQRLKPGVVAKSGVQWNEQSGQSYEQSAADFARAIAASAARFKA